MQRRVHAFSALCVLSAAGVALVVATVPALAAQPTNNGVRQLAVSVPSEAVALAAGATGTVPIRIVNPGPKPVTVQMSGERVSFGDDGRVTIAGSDALWHGRVDFPRDPLVVPAAGYRDVPLRVHMPERISPDLYFVGFVVTPVAVTVHGLTYVNQIGSYLTIDVPGPRIRSLTADLRLPGFTFGGGAVHGQLDIRNVGHAAAQYWIETDTTATPGTASPGLQRYDRSLLPTGRSRTLVVVAKPAFPIAITTVHVHIYYPGRTEASTKEIVLTKRVLVIQPIAVVIAGVAALAGWVWWRRRRRKHRPTTAGTRKLDARPAKTRYPDSRSGGRVPVRAGAAARVDRAPAAVRGGQPQGPGTRR